MTRHRKRKIEHVESVTQQRDADLAAWCEQMGLQADGTPLDGMAAARRSLQQQIADEVREAEQPRYKIPFYKLPFARDL